MGKAKWLGFLLVAVLSIACFAACGNGDNVTKYSVTFYDGTTSLKVVEVEEGKTVSPYEYNKEGYVFTGWFSTPQLSHEFDFTQPITKDTSVFGGFVKFQEDTRAFAVVGSGTSKLLRSSNWGKVINAEHKLTKSDKAGVNEYKITMDLNVDDQFQFAIDTDWANQRGAGYMKSMAIGDTKYFAGSTGYGDSGSKKMNIKCLIDGNYTFTLTTYPAEDWYDEEDENYSEEKKENFNYSNHDSIEWVRNGDVTEGPMETVTNFYIKGAGITNWKDKYTPQVTMTLNEGVHTLSIWLKAEEEFLFTSRVTIGPEEPTTGTEYIRASNIDEEDTATAALFTPTSSYNFKTKAAGLYTFTYTEATKKLTATVDTEKTLEADYYVKGTFASGDITAWNQEYHAEYQLTETEAGSDIYELASVTLAVGDEIVLQSTIKGSTAPGEWGKPGYTRLSTFNVNYIVPAGEANANANFEAVSSTNKNMKATAAGTYKVTFNAYTQEITFTLVTA